MLISVYLPTKNRLTLLQRAVESVLGQTDVELELIVVDDGSTDGTLSYLLELSTRDDRVIYISNTVSVGAPKCRNMAIARARGVYVTGLDDDDYFPPNRLFEMMKRYREIEESSQKFSCVYTQNIEIQTGLLMHPLKPSMVTSSSLYEHNLIGNQFLVRRADVLGLGGFDEDLPAWQDLDLLIRLTEKFGPAYIAEHTIYFYDNSVRTDRISLNFKKVVFARNALVSKYSSATKVEICNLYMQAIRFYPIDVSLHDLKFLILNRSNALNYIRLLKRGVRNMLK